MTTAREYNETAEHLLNGTEEQRLEAIELYQKAIKASAGVEDLFFDHLYAYYRLMSMHYADLQLCAEYAEKCLDLLQGKIASGAIGHFTQEGKLYEEVIRYSTNAIAWHICSTTNDQQKLTYALEKLRFGEGYIDSPEHSYILDTKVRLLLKLNRQDEAYQIVRSCVINDPSVQHFHDITNDDGYTKWKKEFESGLTKTFSAEEKAFLESTSQMIRSIQTEPAKQIKGSVHIAQVPTARFISKQEAEKEYGIPDYFPDGREYLLFDGDLHVKGTIDDAWIMRHADQIVPNKDVGGIIVNGNLVVEGSFIDDNYIYAFIKGNLSCDYIFSYDGHQIIAQDAYVRYAVYGQYNDGQLEVYGKLHTPFIICDDHAMPSKSEGNFVYIYARDLCSRYDIAIVKDTAIRNEWEWEVFEESEKLFDASFWTDQDQFSIARFLHFLREDKNPFHDPETKSTVKSE